MSNVGFLASFGASFSTGMFISTYYKPFEIFYELFCQNVKFTFGVKSLGSINEGNMNYCC